MSARSELIGRARATRLFPSGDIGNDFVPDDGIYRPGFSWPLEFSLFGEEKTRVLFLCEAGRTRFAQVVKELGGETS